MLTNNGAKVKLIGIDDGFIGETGPVGTDGGVPLNSLTEVIFIGKPLGKSEILTINGVIGPVLFLAGDFTMDQLAHFASDPYGYARPFGVTPVKARAFCMSGELATDDFVTGDLALDASIEGELDLGDSVSGSLNTDLDMTATLETGDAVTGYLDICEDL
jgi:hypothetical protein